MRYFSIIAAVAVFLILCVITVSYDSFMPAWDESHFILGTQQYHKLAEQGGRQYYLVHTQAELSTVLARNDESKIIFADGETGPGVQFGFGPAMPATMSLGAANDLELTRRFAQWAGQGLRILGVDVVLTPQADMFLTSASSVIGWRSFGSDPTLVASHAQAYIEGLNSGGVFPIVKHFPGHGITPFDTHDMIGITSASQAEINNHLQPFRILTQTQLDFGILVGHLALKQDQMPGAASDYLLNKLRHDFGFDNVVISDSANMAPVKDLPGGESRFTVEALGNGTDLILEPIRPGKDYHSFLAAKQAGSISKTVVDESNKRLDRLYARITELRKIKPPGEKEWMASGEKLGMELLEKGAIVFGMGTNADLSSRTIVKIVEAELSPEAIAQLQQSLGDRQINQIPEFDPFITPTTTPLCILYWSGGTGLQMDMPWTTEQWEWLKKARDAHTPVTIVVFGNPMAGFQVRDFSNVQGLIAWGRSTLSCKAAALWLNGNFHPKGDWPIE